MTEGNFELVSVIVWYATVLPGVRTILVRDEARLRGVRASRAWPAVSRDAALFAIYNVGFLFFFVLPIHFWRTRRSILGVLIGVGWVVALVAVVIGAQLAAAEAVDLLGL